MSYSRHDSSTFANLPTAAPFTAAALIAVSSTAASTSTAAPAHICKINQYLECFARLQAIPQQITWTPYGTLLPSPFLKRHCERKHRCLFTQVTNFTMVPIPRCGCDIPKTMLGLAQILTTEFFRSKKLLFVGDSLMAQVYEHFLCLAEDLGLLVRTSLRRFQNFQQFFRGHGLRLIAGQWDFIVMSMGAHYNVEGVRERWRGSTPCFKPNDYVIHLNRFISDVTGIAKRSKLLWMEIPTQHFPNGYYTISGKANLNGSCSRLSERGWYNASWRNRLANPVMAAGHVDVLPLLNLSFFLWGEHPLPTRKGEIDCTHYCANSPLMMHSAILLTLKMDLHFSKTK